MQRPDLIADYLDTLTRELRFDIALSRRVRTEVEDHLCEAIAGAAGDASIEAQRRVIANFGDPRDIARRYAASSLFRQIRRVGVIVIVALAGIFISMRGRMAWYGAMQWHLSDRFQHFQAIGLPVARHAFTVALAAGVIALIYIGSRRAPIEFDRTYRNDVNRCVALCAISAVALLTSVIAGVTLTGLRLFEGTPFVVGAVPVLSITLEMTLAGVLFFHLRAIIRRSTFASSLFLR